MVMREGTMQMSPARTRHSQERSGIKAAEVAVLSVQSQVVWRVLLDDCRYPLRCLTLADPGHKRPRRGTWWHPETETETGIWIWSISSMVQLRVLRARQRLQRQVLLVRALFVRWRRQKQW